MSTIERFHSTTIASFPVSTPQLFFTHSGSTSQSPLPSFFFMHSGYLKVSTSQTPLPSFFFMHSGYLKVSTSQTPLPSFFTHSGKKLALTFSRRAKKKAGEWETGNEATIERVDYMHIQDRPPMN